jgi:hypothetical protein
MREKGQSVGKKKKEKRKNTNQVARAPHVRIREKGDPLMFASERGPLCTCEKRGTVRRKEKKKKPHHSMCIALDSGGGRRAGEVADVVRPRRVTSK